MNYVPHELLIRILNNLDVAQICRFSLVNNKWRNIISTDYLWDLVLPANCLPVTKNFKQFIDKQAILTIEDWTRKIISQMQCDTCYKSRCVYVFCSDEKFPCYFEFYCRRTKRQVKYKKEIYYLMPEIQFTEYTNQIDNGEKIGKGINISWIFQIKYPREKNYSRLFTDTLSNIREKAKLLNDDPNYCIIL